MERAPDQPGFTSSPNVQEADECVAGVTVSLDELMLQPDSLYDDSDLSDDDTGNDLPVLPQRSE